MIEKLTVDCILGINDISKYNGNIDFSTGKVNFIINGNTVSIDLIRKEAVHGKYCRGNGINLITTNRREARNFAINTEETFDLKEQVGLRISELKHLNIEQRSQLENILLRRPEVFHEKPGVISGYVCRLNVVPHRTYSHTFYPIPWRLKQLVAEEIQRMI